MAKRFTDTGIWDKEWFMKLKPKHKCLVKFIYDKCDQAGVYEPNWALASMCINEKVSEKDLEIINHQIEVLPNGKLFIPDFIRFQCGTLSETSPAHKPIFQSLQKNNLLDRVLGRVSKTLQEKEIEKEKEEETEKETQGVQGGKFIKPTLSELETYFMTLGALATAPQDFLDHYESNGWKVGKAPMKDWKAACRNWKKNELTFNGKSNNQNTDRHSRAEDISDFRTAVRTIPVD